MRVTILLSGVERAPQATHVCHNVALLCSHSVAITHAATRLTPRYAIRDGAESRLAINTRVVWSDSAQWRHMNHRRICDCTKYTEEGPPWVLLGQNATRRAWLMLESAFGRERDRVEQVGVMDSRWSGADNRVVGPKCCGCGPSPAATVPQLLF